MFKNYLKVAFRNIQRHKIYSVINISSLAVGMACCILIFLYVRQELSYDKYHKDVDRIYRVVMDIKTESAQMQTARVSTPLIPAIKESFPEVEIAVRIHPLNYSRVLVRREDKMFYENKVILAENDIFNVFTIPFIHGDPAIALDRPQTVVISERMAVKYFGYKNPFGNTINITGRNCEITGIIADPPENTHLKYDFILSMKTVERRWDLSNWGWTGFYAYIKLKPYVDADVFERKIRNIANRYIPDKLKEWNQTFIYFLQPIPSIHLHSNLSMEIEAPGNPSYITIFSGTGALILLIACFNFMNLATARSSNRAKEVGVRKVVGAQRAQLVRQFIGESLILALLSLLAALIIVHLALSLFNTLSGKNFSPTDLLQPGVVFILISLTLLVGIAAGSIPAFLLSLFKPIGILKGSLSTGSRGIDMRKILMVSQFTITIILIAGTIMIFRQINFMKNMPLGFEKEQKLVIPANLDNNYESVKSEFLQYPSITGATALWSVPGRQTNIIEARIVSQKDDKAQSMDFHYVDYDFIPEYQIEMVAGRSFQREISSDVEDTFVINETAARIFGFSSPEKAIGKQMYEGGSGNVGIIIGVSRDFHFKGLQTRVEPLVMQFRPNYFSYISLTVKTENLKETLSSIKDKWQELKLGSIFSYFFLDEDFNRQYGSEEKIGRLFATFTLLAIFISCLGLVGLSSFTAWQRTKEIGVRKVLGSSVSGIVLLLSKEFIKWVLLANIIAWPLTYFALHKWLQNFAYRASIGIWTFIISATLALVIALFTISYQSVKAALSNPVDALRYE